jgi:hypothetical protein
MKNLACSLLVFSILFATPCIAAAQEKSAPPKVLVIAREFLKPGRSGSLHEKAESSFVQAMSGAKWPTHYLALTSLSGKSRALFFTFYDSFDAWEKDAAATEKNATLNAALDRAAIADGDLLDTTDQSVWVYRDEFSLRPLYGDLPHRRALEILDFHVRPGHAREWSELVKKVVAGYQKGVPDAHWACFENVYGGAGGTYIFLTARKSASEIDTNFQQDKQFSSVMGEDGLKRVEELEAASVESSEAQLFLFSPKMSYVSDEWIAADPDFWKPKTAATAADKPATNTKKSKTSQ